MSRVLPILGILASAVLVPLSRAAADDDCERYGLTDSSVTTEAGVDLFVRSGGWGEPAVIVPGGFLLEDRLCALAARHRVLFYDMRNRGRSSSVDDGDRLTLEADVADLEAIRRHFDLERPALVGYSYLGKMVVVYALRNPGRVARVVQLGPVPMDPARTFSEGLAEPPITASGAFDGVIREIRARRDEGLHESDPTAYCELEWSLQRQGLVGDPGVAASIPSRCHLPNEWPTRLAFHMQHHFLGSMLASVVTPLELAGLCVPVLTLHGTRDRNAPYGGGREWAASLPGGRLLTMEGMAHAMHRETDLVPILETFLGGAWPDGVEAVEAATDGQRSQLQAWDLLRAASDRHADDAPGGDALTMEWRGALYPRSQGRSPEPPIEPSFPGHWTAILTSDGQRLVFEEEIEQPTFTSRFRSVVTAEDAFDLNLTTGEALPPRRPPGDLQARMIRRVPSMLLAEILTQSPGALRFAGVKRLEGRGVQVVSALHRDERIDLYFDGEPRLVAWGRMSSQPMLGDVYETIHLSSTVDTAGGALPGAVTRIVAGLGVTWEMELATASRTDPRAMAVGRPPRESDTAPPDGAPGPPSAVEALAPGVALWTVPGAPDYKSLVIERPDHLVLVEAPLGEIATGELLAKIRERFPTKPVRWVVATHHHFDHSGGVPRALAEDATLVTTPGNVAFFRRAVTGPHTIEKNESLAETPTVRAVTDTWAIPGGPPTVEVLRVDPNEHVTEMLAVHLPEAKLLFQADLVRFPLEVEQPRPWIEALRRLLASTPGVESIAGVHGEVGRADDL